MAFGIFVIALTIMNASDRPRSAKVPILDDMLRDGAMSYTVGAFLFRASMCDLINYAFSKGLLGECHIISMWQRPL